MKVLAYSKLHSSFAITHYTHTIQICTGEDWKAPWSESTHSKIQVCKLDTCHTDMQGFFGVIINMGLIQLPTLESYWSSSWTCNIPFFSRVFTRNTFEQIFWMLHVSQDDPQNPGIKSRTFSTCSFSTSKLHIPLVGSFRLMRQWWDFVDVFQLSSICQQSQISMG